MLDLDETLVHCSTEPVEHHHIQFYVPVGNEQIPVFVKKRPYFEEFLTKVSSMFEVVLFTASQRVSLFFIMPPHLS